MERVSPFDEWLTFHGLRFTSFFDVAANAWKLLSVEVQDDYGDYSVIRDSSEYSCATSDTLLGGAYDFDFGLKSFSVKTTFSMRSAFVSFSRTFLFFFACCEDTDGRQTAGTPVLATVSLIPWYPYHSGPALHCRVPSRSELSIPESDEHFLVVVERDSCDLLSVELLSCLVFSRSLALSRSHSGRDPHVYRIVAHLRAQRSGKIRHVSGQPMTVHKDVQ